MFFIWLSKSCCNNLCFSKSVARSCECRRKDSSVASIALGTLDDKPYIWDDPNEILKIAFACLGLGYLISIISSSPAHQKKDLHRSILYISPHLGVSKKCKFWSSNIAHYVKNPPFEMLEILFPSSQRCIFDDFINGQWGLQKWSVYK